MKTLHSMTKILMKSLIKEEEKVRVQEMEEVRMQKEAPHEICMDEWAWSAGGAELSLPKHRLGL